MQAQANQKTAAAKSNPAAVAEASELPCRFYDASLLLCMDMLQVDQHELATNDPLLFRELQGRCSLCSHKEECVQDLGHEFDNDRLERWRAYCPNSTMLTTIGAIQNCGYAAQHLKAPHAMRSSEVG